MRKKGEYNSLLCVCVYTGEEGGGDNIESQVSLMMNQREQSRPRV
jgi:hypothetical protein